MKRIGVAFLCLTGLFAMSASASVVQQCAGGVGSSGTVALTTAITNLDQYACGDKTFSAFSATAGVTGNITFTELGSNLYKLSFVYTGTPALMAFDFGFTVAVNLALSPNDFINQITDQMFTQRADQGGNVPNGSTAAVTHTPGGVINLNAGGVGGAQTNTINLNTTSDQLATHYLGNGAPVNGTPGQLTSLEYGISEASVPEPMTLSMMGIGLLGLGLARRRQAKR